MLFPSWDARKYFNLSRKILIYFRSEAGKNYIINKAANINSIEMTRQPYDQFSKQYLSVLFKAFGKIEISQEVSSEIRFVDFSFSPAPEQHENFAKLGLLGKMGAKSSLFEPFRNQPSFSQIRSCVLKLFAIYSELERKARLQKYSLAEADLPLLWILVPSASDNLLDTFGFELKLEQWAPGVYFTDVGFKTGLAVRLRGPCTSTTLCGRVVEGHRK